jgi:hypothetical protein
VPEGTQAPLEVFRSIDPSTAGFKEDLDAKLKEATSRDHSVRVHAKSDATDAEAKLAALEVETKAVTEAVGGGLGWCERQSARNPVWTQ